jgi:putative membrane protein
MSIFGVWKTGVSMTRLANTLIVFSFSAALAWSPAAAQQLSNAAMPPRPAAGMGKASAGVPKQSAGVTAADSAFMKKAARGGLAEVELGRLAAEKASNAEVKKFGQRMVDDHNKANDQLKQVASDRHVELPRAIGAKDKATKENLEKLSGDEFDRAYMSDMVKNHKQDVAEFERESKAAHDPALKGFVTDTLPTFREHLKEAEKLAPGQTAERNSGQ